MSIYVFFFPQGVILPGDVLKMHIVFKSNIGGIFTEKWEFVTHPRLLNSASLVLTLRGVAVQEDRFKKNRILIEVKIFIYYFYFIFIFFFFRKNSFREKQI